MLDLKTTVVPVSTMAHLYELIFLLENNAVVGQVFKEGKWEKVDCFNVWCESHFKGAYDGDDVFLFMQKISSETIVKALETEDEYVVEFSVVENEAEYRKSVKAFLYDEGYVCICVNDITAEFQKEQRRERIVGECIETAQQALLSTERLWEKMSGDMRLPVAQAVAILETGLAKEGTQAHIYIKEAIEVLKTYTDTLDNVFLLSQMEKGTENDDVIMLSDFATDLVKMVQMQTKVPVQDIEIKEDLRRMSGFVSNRLCLQQIAANAMKIMLLNGKEGSVHTVLDYEAKKKELCFIISADGAEAMFIHDPNVKFIQRLTGYMQGRVHFKTEEERTELLIVIPVKCADKEALKNAKAMARMRDSIRKNDFSAFRALVIDDDIICREITVAKLKQFGLVVETAEDGAEAMQKLMASPARYYQIIFTKMILPKKSGLDMTMELRELSRRDLNDITIVAVTMKPETDRRITALEHGMDYHLVLPFNDFEVNEILLRELENLGPESAHEKFGFRIIK